MQFISKMIEPDFFANLGRILFCFNYYCVEFGKYGRTPTREVFFITINRRHTNQILEMEGFVKITDYPLWAEDVGKYPKNELGCYNNFRILIDDKIEGFKIEWELINED
jgi:hypothetical protein